MEQVGSLSSSADTFTFSVPDRELMGIECPFFIENPENALRMLGGREQILQAFSQIGSSTSEDESLALHHPLELRFRPDDPFSHPIPGSIVPCCQVVLRVVRKKQKDAPPSSKDRIIHVEAVGRIERSGRFRAMADYQYIPDLHAHSTVIRDHLKHFQIDPVLAYTPLDPPPDCTEPFNLLPPLFSRVEFKQFGRIERALAPNEWMALAQQPRRTKYIAMGIPFSTDLSISVPTEPPEMVNAYRSLLLPSLILELEQLFTQRPIWSRASLLQKLSSEAQSNLKLLLPIVAYYFTNGPWRACWVQYGFDPRQTLASRFYQMLDSRRVTISMDEKETEMIGQGDGGGSIALRSIRPLKRLLSRRRTVESMHSHSTPRTELMIPSRLSIQLRPNTPLHQYRNYYQLCDLMYLQMQRIIYAETGLRIACDERDGWYPKGTIDQLRQFIRETAREKSKPGWIPPSQALEEQEGEETVPSVESFHVDIVPSGPTTTQPLSSIDTEDIQQRVQQLMSKWTYKETHPMAHLPWSLDEGTEFAIFGEDEESTDDKEEEESE